MLKPLPAVFCGILLILVCSPPTGVAQESKSAGKPRLDRLLPRWEVGNRWTVEVLTRPLHIRAETDPASFSSPLRWLFDVVALGDIGSHPCFRVEVTYLPEAKRIPKTVLWLDRESCTLRQVTTFLPVPGGFQEMTLSYDSASGQPAPILGPLSALPIDTPVLYAGTKGLQTFTYTSHAGLAESKALGDVGFCHQVEQHISDLPQHEVDRLVSAHFAKSLVDDAFTKSLTTCPVTEVRLKSQGREVRQLWQAGRPWPIYCDNGFTVSRLVAVEMWEDRP